MPKILIARPVLVSMLSHAREAAPFECCGLLSGKGRHTSGITRATNQLVSTSAFFIPPEDLFDFFRKTRASGLDLTGIYHSHPATPAFPSARDAAEFHYHDACYWIISLAKEEPDVRCYRWGKMAFEEIDYQVVE